ncbi:MAG TPA: MaoC family dehydratase N-terminal domain-containing protein [Actinomycetes bacterium]|nr:MaoC family dehydratase N-terminal domain-containing protein [Actinomycetes bacterium]
MALNVDLVGKKYPGHHYEVGREKIREFADAIGDSNPVYRDAGAAQALGHADVVAPPTFGVVLTRGPQLAVIDDPELGLDFSRVVHGDQKFFYTRPVVAGEVLQSVASIEAARTMAGNDILTIRTDVVDPSGAPVLTAMATLVARASEEA